MTDFSTAVALIIFKRPIQTERVFRAIAEEKPSRLYVIADGPQDPGEESPCQQTRQIVENVNWDCDMRRNYSETNLGVRNRVISGLDWVFGIEESAIILEDDCLPHPHFFRFCEELLGYYKDDQRVMHISGDNFLRGRRVSPESYYFSKYAHIWGWATWRRAWSLFHAWDDDSASPDLDLKIFETRSERKFWQKLLDELRSRKMGYTWDYQWALTCMAGRGLCVMPKYNLVSNIGFGEDATHTRERLWYANLPVTPMEFPLVHPVDRNWNSEADRITGLSFFTAEPPSLLNMIRKAVRRVHRLTEKNHEM
jgi:hypothetical protein